MAKTVQVKGFSAKWLEANLDRVQRAIKGTQSGGLTCLRVASVHRGHIGNMVDVFVTCLLLQRKDGPWVLLPAGPLDEATLREYGLAAE